VLKLGKFPVDQLHCKSNRETPERNIMASAPPADVAAESDNEAARCPEYISEEIPTTTGTFEGIETPGYPKLADLMAQYHEAAIFRRFRSLNLFNLMRIQAELVELEDRLREVFKAKEKGRSFLLQDFFEIGNGDDELQELLLSIDQKLRDYSMPLPSTI